MWALIENGLVLETTDTDPMGRYHESLTWLACEDEVKYGWVHDGESFQAPEPQLNETQSAERAWRDQQLTSSEWLVTRHRDEQDMQLATTLTAEQFAELLVYRQALRDWPQTEAFPDSAQRPLAPAWIAEQVL